jgi:CRP-like cAMP-binding protein
MEKYLPVIQTCHLFEGIEPSDLPVLLDCLAATRASFEKNSFIFMAGDPARSVGVVLSGRAHILQEDYWGNRSILTWIERGGLFGEAMACAEIPRLPVSVIAAEASDVLLINCGRIVAICPSACPFHARLVKNMVRILANKNVTLTQKIEHLTRRTTREKLLSYLSEQADRAVSDSFEIPFNRQELAEYLSVDRSAMSNELSKMRDENLLRYRRKYFELISGHIDATRERKYT